MKFLLGSASLLALISAAHAQDALKIGPLTGPVGPFTGTVTDTTDGSSASVTFPAQTITLPGQSITTTGGGGGAVNGVCGSANGVAVSNAPTANLCSAGSPTSVSGSGPWTWSCNGSNGGSNATCSAPVSGGGNSAALAALAHQMTCTGFVLHWPNKVTPCAESEGQPIVIDNYSGGAIYETSTPPSGFKSVQGWGAVYQIDGASVAPNNARDTVTIANYQTWAHYTNGTWAKIQDQATIGVSGANYAADFGGAIKNFSVSTVNSDGSYTFNTPPPADGSSSVGYNDHFFFNTIPTFTAGSVDGILTEAQIKTNDAAQNLVVQFGADWYLNPSIPGKGVFNSSNYAEAGGTNWIKLTTSYRTVYFTTFQPSAIPAGLPQLLSP